MTTPPLKATTRKQIQIWQVPAPLNVVIHKEGISISVASYSQYCTITWWQIIKSMAPPMYSKHKLAVDHIKEQANAFKEKQANKKAKVKDKQESKKEYELEHARQFWINLAQTKIMSGRRLGQLLARSELQSLQPTNIEEKDGTDTKG